MLLRPAAAPCAAQASTSAPSPAPRAAARPAAPSRGAPHRRRRGVVVAAEREPGRPPTRRRPDGLRARYDGYDRPPSRRNSGEAPPEDEYDDEWEDEAPPPAGPPPRSTSWLDGFSWRGGPLTGALAAGAFALGIGAGVALDTVVTLDRDNVASSVMFDRSSPNSDACAAFGASAVVFDQRIFLSFNPFNVYVTQPEVKPGCVLRRSNWNVLEGRKLVDDTQVNDCKRHMNTFAFVGNLEDSPEVSCVYHSEQAENQYLRDPLSAAMGDGKQTRDANRSFN